jgi:hypothetical protein
MTIPLRGSATLFGGCILGLAFAHMAVRVGGQAAPPTAADSATRARVTAALLARATLVDCGRCRLAGAGEEGGRADEFSGSTSVWAGNTGRAKGRVCARGRARPRNRESACRGDRPRRLRSIRTALGFPWRLPVLEATAKTRCERPSGIWRLGFIANLKLAEFGGADAGLNVFNRSVEGGLGSAWRASEDFALALTYERVLSRQLRSFAIPGDAPPVGRDGAKPDFAPSNNQYFYDDNLSAVSLKFVFTVF